MRLNEEIRIDHSGIMVTLTLTEHDLIQLTKDVFEELTPLSILENEVARLATRRFLERWRKKYKKLYFCSWEKKRSCSASQAL